MERATLGWPVVGERSSGVCVHPGITQGVNQQPQGFGAGWQVVGAGWQGLGAGWQGLGAGV